MVIGKYMKIEITQDDIDNGSRMDASNCAIARAIKRMTGSNYVRVGSKDIYIDGQLFIAPLVVTEFVKKFDESKSLVSPFVVFMLEGFQPGNLLYSPKPLEYIYIKPPGYLLSSVGI